MLHPANRHTDTFYLLAGLVPKHERVARVADRSHRVGVDSHGRSVIPHQRFRRSCDGLHMLNSRFDAKREWRYTTLAIAIAVATGIASVRFAAQQGGGQKAGRLNKVIEAVEAGRAAVGGQDWRFIDMEHGPFSMDQFESTLAQMGKD